jgi:hypothetical protein
MLSLRLILLILSYATVISLATLATADQQAITALKNSLANLSTEFNNPCGKTTDKTESGQHRRSLHIQQLISDLVVLISGGKLLRYLYRHPHPIYRNYVCFIRLGKEEERERERNHQNKKIEMDRLYTFF